MEYWDSTMEQLFSTLADTLTAEYLVKVGLKLTCTWSGSRTKTMMVETVDGRKWPGSTTALRGVYPLQPLNSYENELMWELSQLVQVGPTVQISPWPMTAEPAAYSVVQPSPTFPPPPIHQTAPEIISVVVPANYPLCGHVISIASPTTGRIAQVTVPPGSLPGGQFLVQFS
jgi:hypothetical protein